jgi:hypothetical protein
MPSRIDNIILPRHDIEISILVLEARITRIIRPRDRAKIFLNVCVVVVENSQHERWRQRLLHIDGTHLCWPAFLTSSRVDDFDVETGKGLASRSWFLREGVETQIVREDRPSGLSLPVVVVDQFAFEVVLNPLESRDVATLAHQRHIFEMRDVVLLDVISLGILLADGADSSWRCIEMVD